MSKYTYHTPEPSDLHKPVTKGEESDIIQMIKKKMVKPQKQVFKLRIKDFFQCSKTSEKNNTE